MQYFSFLYAILFAAPGTRAAVRNLGIEGTLTPP